MPKIIFSDTYKKRAIKFFKLHPSLLKNYKKKLFLLEMNPFHPSLRIHKLKGKHSNYYSISINMKYRIMIDFIIQENQIILLDIGDHNRLYRY